MYRSINHRHLMKQLATPKGGLMKRTNSAWAKLVRSAGLGALLVLFLASVPSASAKQTASLLQATTAGNITYVTKNFTLAKGKWATLKVPCPSGTHVLGGGHYNSGGFGDVIVPHSYPYDSGDADSKPDDGWAADLGSMYGTVTVTMHAECGPILPFYRVATTTVPARFPPSLEGGLCPASDPNVLSGGSRGPRNVQEFWTYPAANRWLVFVDNLGNLPRTATIIAVCSTLDTANATSSAGNVSTRSQASVNAQCPSGAPYVVGGGVATNTAPFGMRNIAASRPYGVTEWQVWVDNFSGNSQTFQAGAVCIPTIPTG
ncbi:MAG TPA: hypothetical protein VF660_03770 [Actinomycetota bacterium]